MTHAMNELLQCPVHSSGMALSSQLELSVVVAQHVNLW